MVFNSPFVIEFYIYFETCIQIIRDIYKKNNCRLCGFSIGKLSIMSAEKMKFYRETTKLKPR